MNTVTVAEVITGRISWSDGLPCDCGIDIDEWTVSDVFVSRSTACLYMHANCECGRRVLTLDVTDAIRVNAEAEPKSWISRAVRIIAKRSLPTAWELTIEQI